MTIPKAGSFRRPTPTPLYSQVQAIPSLADHSTAANSGSTKANSEVPNSTSGGSNRDFTPRAGAGSADEPTSDLELARRIPDARRSGREGRGDARGGEEKGRTVRRLFMAAGAARREKQAGGDGGGGWCGRCAEGDA
jgi:hypothetical protein